MEKLEYLSNNNFNKINFRNFCNYSKTNSLKETPSKFQENQPIHFGPKISSIYRTINRKINN